MADATTNHDDLGRYRADGVSEWSPQHITAARLRAEGRGWADIAEVTGYARSTVKNYTTIDGFGELVEHFQEQLFQARIDKHWRHGSPEALDILRDEMNAKRKEMARLEQKAAAGAIDPDEAGAAIGLSRAIVKACDKYLEATGFKKYQQTRGKMQAEKEEFGEAGERVRIQQVRAEQEALEDVDPTHLADMYDKLFEDNDDA